MSRSCCDVLRHYRQQRRVAIGDALCGLRQVFRRTVCDFLTVGFVPAIFTTHDRKLRRASLWRVTVLTLALIAFLYAIPYLPVEWMRN